MNRVEPDSRYIGVSLLQMMYGYVDVKYDESVGWLYIKEAEE